MSYPNQGSPEHNVPSSQQPSTPEQPYGTPPYGPPAQPYGTPAPSYGTPASAYATPAPPAGYGTARRPGTVNAAAILGFLGAAVYLVAAIFVAAKANSGNAAKAFFYVVANAAPAVFYVVAAICLLVGGLYIWGGVTALRGRTSHILFWTSAVIAITDIIEVISGTRSGIWPIIAIIFPILIMILLLVPSSRNFFRARGGSTI